MSTSPPTFARFPEFDRPCFMRGCPFVAQGFDQDSARLKLREHLEAEHLAVVPELQKAGVIQ